MGTKRLAPALPVIPDFSDDAAAITEMCVGNGRLPPGTTIKQLKDARRALNILVRDAATAAVALYAAIRTEYEAADRSAAGLLASEKAEQQDAVTRVVIRNIAEMQREACAKRVREWNCNRFASSAGSPEDSVRATPLVACHGKPPQPASEEPLPDLDEAEREWEP